MNIHLIAAGTRMPEWVRSGYEEFARRLPRECSLKLVEIPVAHRGKNADISRVRQQEGARMLDAIPDKARIIALDEHGVFRTSRQLATTLDEWMMSGQDVALLVGGPDGLDAACTERAQQKWSLSPLTFPHGMVRVMVAEQLYRAWTLLRGHPYHRDG